MKKSIQLVALLLTVVMGSCTGGCGTKGRTTFSLILLL